MYQNGQKWPFTDRGRLVNFTLVRYRQIMSDIVKYNSHGILRVFHGCFKGVSREFWGCSKGVSGGKFIAGFNGVTRLIQKDSLGVARIIVGCSKGAQPY